MVGDEDAGRAGSRQPVHGLNQRLTTRHIKPGVRLVEHDQRGVVHQRSSQHDPLPFPARQRAERSRAIAAKPDVGQQGLGPAAIVLRVVVPPRLEGGVASAHHHLGGRQPAPKLVDQTGRRDPDPGP